MRLHLLFLILQTLVSLLLFLHSRLQVVKDVFQLLLPGQQANSHLFGLGKQLGFSVELLGQDVLLFDDLREGSGSVMLLQGTVLAFKTNKQTNKQLNSLRLNQINNLNL